MREFLSNAVLLVLCACGSVSNDQPDAKIESIDACVPETDQTFCANLTSACESHTAVDNCGVERTVDCGSCTGGQGCVVGTCKTPVCTTFDYATTTLTAFSRVSIEDSLASATPDGQVILYVPSASGCGAFQLVVADETAPGSGTYTQRDVTTAFQGMSLSTGQDSHAISADGLTIIARQADSKGFLSTKRSAINLIDFGTPSAVDFDAINAQVASNAGGLSGPVMSADGLQFVYSIFNVDATTDGIYSTVRTSTLVPFPAGTKMPPPVSDYSLATALSSDRLTLFVFYNFQGRVLTRLSTTQPFINPNAPADPPTLAGWQHKPLAACTKLLAMTSPGGCANEDVVLLTRQ